MIITISKEEVINFNMTNHAMNIKKKSYNKKQRYKPGIDKEHLINLASEILARVEIAENAHQSSMEWYTSKCSHGSENQTYWEWITEAEDNLVKAINSLSH